MGSRTLRKQGHINDQCTAEIAGGERLRALACRPRECLLPIRLRSKMATAALVCFLEIYPTNARDHGGRPRSGARRQQRTPYTGIGCNATLVKEHSATRCNADTFFRCSASEDAIFIWVDKGCRGRFHCGGGSLATCAVQAYSLRLWTCRCSDRLEAVEAWTRGWLAGHNASATPRDDRLTVHNEPSLPQCRNVTALGFSAVPVRSANVPRFVRIGDCCSSDPRLRLGQMSDVAGPNDCEQPCLDQPKCTHFVHSVSKRECVFCSGCAAGGSASSSFTSWMHVGKEGMPSRTTAGLTRNCSAYRMRNRVKLDDGSLWALGAKLMLNQSLGRATGNEAALRCTRVSGILRASDVCLLAATTVNSTSRYFPKLASSLDALLSAHPWVRAALNFYDGARSADVLLHSHVATFAVPGFKSRFWKQALSPQVLAAFTHVFLFDEDMRIHPSEFQLVTFVRIYEQTNVSILAPSPYYTDVGLIPQGLYRLTAGTRCGRTWTCHRACKSGHARAQESCAVCRTSTIEMKAPLFSLDAWAVVHDQILSRLPDRFHVGPSFDMTWCRLLELFRHGCDPRLQPPNQCRTLGGACAVSFVTPMIDDNHRTLSEFGRDCTVNDTSTTCSALRGRPHYSSAMVIRALINLGVEEFRAMPSWRPANSLFHSQEHGPPGCWSRGALREGFNALRSLSVAQDVEVMRHLNLVSRRSARYLARRLPGYRHP